MFYLIQEVPKTKKQVPEKVPAKKTFKGQLIEAVEKLEAQQGKLNLAFQTVTVGKQKEFCTVISVSCHVKRNKVD